MRRRHVSQQYGNANHAFFSYVTNFDAVTFSGNAHQRSDAMIDEVGVLDVIIDVVENLMSVQAH
jgi:hypothetical protein